MFKVTTMFNMDKVRQYCIKNGFYTCGDCDEYSQMLNYVRTHATNPEVSDVKLVATDIYDHSALDRSYDGYTGVEIIANIMFGLLNECMTRFVDVEE